MAQHLGNGLSWIASSAARALSASPAGAGAAHPVAMEVALRAGGADAGAGDTTEAAALLALQQSSAQRARRSGDAALAEQTRSAVAGAGAEEEEAEEEPHAPLMLRLKVTAKDASPGSPSRGGAKNYPYSRNPATGFFGVHQQGRVFTGAFSLYGKRYTSVGHPTAELAARAYDELGRQVGLPRERLNFPDGYCAAAVEATAEGAAAEEATGGDADAETSGAGHKGPLYSCCYKLTCSLGPSARGKPGFKPFHFARKKCPSCNSTKPGVGWPRAKPSKRTREREDPAEPAGAIRAIDQTDPRCCSRAGCAYSHPQVATKTTFYGWGRSKGTCDGCHIIRPKEGWPLLYPEQPLSISLPGAKMGTKKRRMVEAKAARGDERSDVAPQVQHAAVPAQAPPPPLWLSPAPAPSFTPARAPAGVEAFIRDIKGLSNVEGAVAAATRKRLSLSDFQEARAALASPDSAQARNEDLCFLAGLLDVTEEADIYRLRMAIRKLPAI